HVGLRDDGHVLGGSAGLEGVDRALRPDRRQHHDVAGSVDREVDRIGRRVALYREPFVRAPAIDTVEVVVDEVELAVRRDGRTGDRPETVRELFDLGCGRRRHGCRGAGPDVEHGELALAYFETAGEVVDRVRVRELARAQEGAATVAVAGTEAALRVDVDVAEADVVHVLQHDRRTGRLVRPGHPVAVIVGNQDVARVPDLQRDRIRTLADFLFGLRRVERPVP